MSQFVLDENASFEEQDVDYLSHFVPRAESLDDLKAIMLAISQPVMLTINPNTQTLIIAHPADY